ncbi:MAG: hypothetical protein GX481_01555 [Atopobium sp.]|jgi:polyhydroxyalkanoate synthesis regulator phasin|nr:hypothetical protein [Atopobium sp.]
MAFFDDMSDTMYKVFLAGVGAVATTAEKSSKIVDDLVKKGELTVEQGKTLNEALKHKAAEASSDSEAAILRAHLKNMTPEQRAAYVKKVQKIRDDLDAEPVEVDVEDDSDDDAAGGSKAEDAD